MSQFQLQHTTVFSLSLITCSLLQSNIHIYKNVKKNFHLDPLCVCVCARTRVRHLHKIQLPLFPCSKLAGSYLLVSVSTHKSVHLGRVKVYFTDSVSVFLNSSTVLQLFHLLRMKLLTPTYFLIGPSKFQKYFFCPFSYIFVAWVAQSVQ